MSVLIRGAEMPQDCPMCPMAHFDAAGLFRGCEIVPGKKHAMQDPLYAQSNCRPGWCPLIEIPAHGRLIDADALNYTMLYKEDWIAGTGTEAPAV